MFAYMSLMQNWFKTFFRRRCHIRTDLRVVLSWPEDIDRCEKN